MSFRQTACLILCAGLTVIAAPAMACDNPSCLNVQPEPEAAQPAAKPLRLSRFARKPIATAAVRTVKTRDGHYAPVSLAHRARHGAKSVASTKTDTKTDSHPLAMPARPADVAVTPAAESLPAAAAQAFASVPYATARVRVVTPEELREIGKKADEAAFAPAPISSHAPATAYNGVQVVSADAVNAIDLKADTTTSAARDVATAGAAAATSETRHENATLLQRMLIALGGAFVTAAAAVKALIG